MCWQQHTTQLPATFDLAWESFEPSHHDTLAHRWPTTILTEPLGLHSLREYFDYLLLWLMFLFADTYTCKESCTHQQIWWRYTWIVIICQVFRWVQRGHFIRNCVRYWVNDNIVASHSVSSKNYAHSFCFVTSCRGLVLVDFTHVIQGYFTSIGATIWLSQCQWCSPKGYG